jgi:hypothetical protein
LKVRFLVGLEVSPRILLRNGHLHTLARADRSVHAMVMAETQISPEYLAITDPRDRQSRQSSAACASLSSEFNCQRTQPADNSSGQSLRTGFRDNRAPFGRSRLGATVSRRAMPDAGAKRYRAPTKNQLIVPEPGCQHLT